MSIGSFAVSDDGLGVDAMDLLKPDNPSEWDEIHADELREVERILAEGPSPIKWGLVIINERMD